MKWPFRRNKDDANIPSMPPEVQQYYQAEARERTGVAWLLAGITLVVTVLIIVGLFFGGRWIYRKTRHNPAQVAQTTNQPAAPSENTANTSSSSSNSSTTSSTSSTSSNTSTPASSTPSSTTPSTSQGVVGPTAARTSIPNTGPGDTLALFVGVTALGYLAHRFWRSIRPDAE
jgi:cytoskeletal protein RodZ